MITIEINRRSQVEVAFLRLFLNIERMRLTVFLFLIACKSCNEYQTVLKYIAKRVGHLSRVRPAIFLPLISLAKKKTEYHKTRSILHEQP